MRRYQPMTLLQRAVIQRLREGGYDSLADLAREAWQQGEALPLTEPAESMPSNLATDFARANGQARAKD